MQPILIRTVTQAVHWYCLECQERRPSLFSLIIIIIISVRAFIYLFFIIYCHLVLLFGFASLVILDCSFERIQLNYFSYLMS